MEEEEEIERLNLELLIKVQSQLYRNNEEMERIKAESKRIRSLKSNDEMKRLYALPEFQSLESLEPLKEALKRLNAESKSLKQERDRLKFIHQINLTYPRISGATLDTAKKLMIRSPATFKRTANKIRPSSVAGCTKAASVTTTTSVVTSSMSATAMNNVSTPVITLDELLEKLGQSSTSMFVCDICTDSTALERSFSFKGCHQKYCKDCVHKYVASKLAQNIAPTTCPAPDCKGELEPDHCRSILPQEVFVKWCDKLCEAEVQGFTKLYCPYEDCSGMLIDDGTQKMIKESECPHCNRLFCAQCKVPWHSEINCEEFQKRKMYVEKLQDIKFMELARTNGWKTCPNCKMYVEKTSGCNSIRCRCGAHFYYTYPNIVLSLPRNRRRP